MPLQVLPALCRMLLVLLALLVLVLQCLWLRNSTTRSTAVRGPCGGCTQRAVAQPLLLPPHLILSLLLLPQLLGIGLLLGCVPPHPLCVCARGPSTAPLPALFIPQLRQPPCLCSLVLLLLVLWRKLVHAWGCGRE